VESRPATGGSRDSRGLKEEERGSPVVVVDRADGQTHGRTGGRAGGRASERTRGQAHRHDSLRLRRGASSPPRRNAHDPRPAGEPAWTGRSRAQGTAGKRGGYSRCAINSREFYFTAAYTRRRQRRLQRRWWWWW